MASGLKLGRLNAKGMIHLLFRASTATAGGGLTYLRNVIPHLGQRNDVTATFVTSNEPLAGLTYYDNVVVLRLSQNSSVRPVALVQEQLMMRQLIRDRGIDVVISTGNFALANCPVPQILLSRNALYTSADFMRDLRRRRAVGLWLDTRIKAHLAKWSIRIADCVVAPSQAFARELEQWTGTTVRTIYHGFDREQFFAQGNVSQVIQQALKTIPANALKLLFVSHYNYYRNFETLFRALPIVKRKLGRDVRLLLTCHLQADEHDGPYRTESAAAQVVKLGIRQELVELGPVPYKQLHHLYKACDFYVTPAYAETFAHPLVESMASGLPVIASDIPVHREICGRAVLYFPRFSAEQLAERVVQLANSEHHTVALRKEGLERAKNFSWRLHVDELVSLAAYLHTNRLSSPKQADSQRIVRNKRIA